MTKRNWRWASAAVGLAMLCASIYGSPLMAQNGRATNGPPSGNANTGLVRSAQDDGSGGGASVAAAAAAVKATPAIWKVKGAHGTVYLFGTIHVMKPEVDWETAKVKQALEASGTVYAEVANLDDQTAALPLAAQFGMDLAHPLSTKISKEDVAMLDTAVKSMGMPGEAMLEPMQPWLVSIAISVLPMTKAGYDSASGVDVVLLGQARKAGKKIEGFETMEQQLHFVADEPEAEQVAKLHEELAEMDKDTVEMNEMVASWEKGDVAKIGELENGELKVKHPKEYKTLVVDRNTKWAATLDGLLRDPSAGDVFVAVGAAHLAGQDSVVEMLKKDGWVVERE